LATIAIAASADNYQPRRSLRPFDLVVRGPVTVDTSQVVAQARWLAGNNHIELLTIELDRSAG